MFDELEDTTMTICNVCIDFSRVKQRSEFAWTAKYYADKTTPPLTPGEIEADIVAEIENQLAALPRACPVECPIYLMFCFHLDPKPIMAPPPLKPTWDQGVSAKNVLDQLAGKASPPPISEVYLKSCESNTQTEAVKSAFKNPKVKKVYTVDDTLLAACSNYITGAHYPTFRPIPLRIQVWTNPTTNTEINLGSNKKYMIEDGTVQDWASSTSP
jgi:hypothetical protein